MQITETSAVGLKREYRVVVAAKDIAQRLDGRISKLAKEIRLPGFRPGKVPASVVKKRFGGSLLGEVLEETVNDSSQATIRDNNLRPALQPKVSIESFEEGSDLILQMSVEVLPEIEPIDYASISLERLKPEISDGEIDTALTRLAERFQKTEPVAVGTAAETGDTVVIDFVGTIDGEEFPGGAMRGHNLELGSNRFIPGFEDQLVGAKAGDKIEVKVTFPAEYPAEQLRSKDAVFAVEVKEVRRKQPVVIDESLAEDVGMESLEALRQAIRSQMEGDYNNVSRQRLKRDLLDILSERFKFEVPEGMVELEFDGIWKQYEEEKARTPEAEPAAEDAGKSEDEIKAEYRAIAERRVRLGLLLAEVGRLNNIQVSQDELNRAVVAEARKYQGQEKVVFDYFKNNPDAVNGLRAPLYEEKVVDFLFEMAQVTDKPVSPEDLLKATNEDGEDAAA
jgi:trigger factor